MRHPYRTEELQELLEHGDAAKRRAATAMNERSTRAHTVFVLSLQARRGRFEAWAWSSPLFAGECGIHQKGAFHENAYNKMQCILLLFQVRTESECLEALDTARTCGASCR